MSGSIHPKLNRQMSWTQNIRSRPITGLTKSISEIEQDESVSTVQNTPVMAREVTVDDRLSKLKQFLTVSDKVILETKVPNHKKSASEVQQPAIMTRTNAFLVQRIEELEAELDVKNQMIELLQQQVMSQKNQTINSTLDTSVFLPYKSQSYAKEHKRPRVVNPGKQKTTPSSNRSTPNLFKSKVMARKTPKQPTISRDAKENP